MQAKEDVAVPGFLVVEHSSAQETTLIHGQNHNGCDCVSKALLPVLTLSRLAYHAEVEKRIRHEHEIVLLLIGDKHPSITSAVSLAKSIDIIDRAQAGNPAAETVGS
jgi:hypothetical protein